MKELSKATELKDNEFNVIKFTATWCGPCKTMKVIMDELERKFPNVNFVEVDIDKDMDKNDSIARKYNVSSVPSLLLTNRDRIMETVIGLRPKEVIKTKINNLLTKGM